jgi:hypothetical protein
MGSDITLKGYDVISTHEKYMPCQTDITYSGRFKDMCSPFVDKTNAQSSGFDPLFLGTEATAIAERFTTSQIMELHVESIKRSLYTASSCDYDRMNQECISPNLQDLANRQSKVISAIKHPTSTTRDRDNISVPRLLLSRHRLHVVDSSRKSVPWYLAPS